MLASFSGSLNHDWETFVGKEVAHFPVKVQYRRMKWQTTKQARSAQLLAWF